MFDLDTFNRYLLSFTSVIIQLRVTQQKKNDLHPDKITKQPPPTIILSRAESAIEQLPSSLDLCSELRTPSAA